MNPIQTSLALLLTSLAASGAETNIFTRCLAQDTNCIVRFLPAEGGILIDLPSRNPNSKFKFTKSISFNEAQRWHIVRLMADFTSLALKLEEQDMKFFTTHLATLTPANPDLTWATAFDATVYVGQDGKALLVLAAKHITNTYELLDYWEAQKVIELIKLVPNTPAGSQKQQPVK